MHAVIICHDVRVPRVRARHEREPRLTYDEVRRSGLLVNPQMEYCRSSGNWYVYTARGGQHVALRVRDETTVADRHEALAWFEAHELYQDAPA